MPDIFLSYAHVDNKPPAGMAMGWVSCLVENLRNGISRKMGRDDDYEFWMDFCLKGHDSVTPEIEKQVANAETLVIMLSTGWLASVWCQDELRIFCRTHADFTKRIFVVELDKIKLDDKPEAMRDLLAFPFWRLTNQDRVRQLGHPIPQPDDAEYYDRLADLSHDLADALKVFQVAPVKPPQKPAATVYLAPVNDSLLEQRANLISEFRQFGINVLPHHNQIALGGFTEAFALELSQCSHFVQLLDEQYSFGIPANQFLVAETAEIPVLQWRSRTLDLTKSTANHDQLALLESKYVIASSLSEFAQHVIDKVLPKPSECENKPVRMGSHPSQKMIFVHAGQQDFNWAADVADTLRQRGFGIALPRYNGDSTSIRKSIERGLVACNILLMLQRETPAEVVEDFLSEAYLHNTEKNKEIPLLICQGGLAERLCFHPPGAKVFNCDSQVFGERCLEQFLEEVGI